MNAAPYLARLAALKAAMPPAPWEPIVDRATGAEIIVALASATGDTPHGTVVVAGVASPEVQCWIAGARNAPIEETLAAALDLIVAMRRRDGIVAAKVREVQMYRAGQVQSGEADAYLIEIGGVLASGAETQAAAARLEEALARW